MKKPQLLLLAPVMLLLAALTRPGQEKPPSTNGWQQTQKKDAGDPPALVVTCKLRASRRKFSTAYVNVGAPLSIEYVEPDEIKAGISYFPKVTVQYRLDD